MKIIEPSCEILNPPDYFTMLRHVELAARTCYKSEDMIAGDSAKFFIRRIIDKNHLSVLEHCNISVRIICDRGVSHELVRHRLCSFSQESTRYCNYSGDKFGSEITFIRPVFWKEEGEHYKIWMFYLKDLEHAYMTIIERDSNPQEARSILPNSLKTEIVVTANIRQWRTMFEQRVSLSAHPQMIQVMAPLLEKFMSEYPVFFDDMADVWSKAKNMFTNKHWQFAEVQ